MSDATNEIYKQITTMLEEKTSWGRNELKERLEKIFFNTEALYALYADDTQTVKVENPMDVMREVSEKQIEAMERVADAIRNMTTRIEAAIQSY